MSPYFYSLSLLVSGRGWHDSPWLSAVDGLAYAIERENEPEPLPTLVAMSVDIFVHALNARSDQRVPDVPRILPEPKQNAD